MRAVVLEEPGRFAPVELPEAAAPGPCEVLVAIRRVGVCGTDLHAFHGRQPFFTYPRILGHELGVEVLAVGPGVSRVRAGDRCALRPYLDCGTCDTCRRGRPNCCTSLAVLGAHIDGGMRERLVVPDDHLHPSTTLSFEELALVETLSIGGHAVARVEPAGDERVLVVGAGPIGLAVATFLNAQGIAPVLADLSAGRRAFAASWAGVRTIDPGDDAAPAARAAFGGELPTLVFDATGDARSMTRSFSLVAHGGRLVFVGLVQGEIAFFDPDLHRRELTLYASRNATAADFDRSVRLLESGTLDLGPWMTDRCTLDEVPAIFPTWADGNRPGQVKGLISIE
jgi:2-desacetyl-2-hydroxyethyl bacteriochlorophyllide A dehydrogenase